MHASCSLVLGLIYSVLITSINPERSLWSFRLPHAISVKSQMFLFAIKAAVNSKCKRAMPPLLGKTRKHSCEQWLSSHEADCEQNDTRLGKHYLPLRSVAIGLHVLCFRKYWTHYTWSSLDCCLDRESWISELNHHLCDKKHFVSFLQSISSSERCFLDNGRAIHTQRKCILHVLIQVDD